MKRKVQRRPAKSTGVSRVTSAVEASALSPAPPPYLFVDLSSVHEDAFSELVSAYKEQVKRSDYSDLARIDNFKQRLLNITLTAAGAFGSITDAIIHLIKSDGSDQ